MDKYKDVPSPDRHGQAPSPLKPQGVGARHATPWWGASVLLARAQTVSRMKCFRRRGRSSRAPSRHTAIIAGLLLCVPATAQSTPADQTMALEKLYEVTAGSGWSTKSNWMSGSPCTGGTSNWAQVGCSSGDVTQLCVPAYPTSASICEVENEYAWSFVCPVRRSDLGSISMTGTLPSEIGLLTEITELCVPSHDPLLKMHPVRLRPSRPALWQAALRRWERSEWNATN